MATPSLLKEGMVWRVGNGHNISIWNQKWLPQSLSFKVRSLVKVLDENSKVRELIIEDLHCWNEKLIFDIFEKDEAIQICQHTFE